MQTWRLFVIGSLIGAFLLGGLGCDRASSPTAPVVLDERAMRGLPSKPADDTGMSDIVKAPYRAYQIVAVGDSITTGVCASRGTDGYPGWLESQLRTSGYENTVYNKGEPGAISEDLLNDIDRYVRGMDIALIMIGTNDISASTDCLNPSDPATCRTLSHIRTLIDRTLQANVVPVLGAVTPKRSTAFMAIYNPRIEALNSQLAALAAEYQITFVDTYHAIWNHGGDALFCDKHHFTDQGYIVLADAFYQALTTHVLYQKF